MPDAVISSPYRRAAETARIAFDGLALDVEQDERLRERDLGLFDGLTGRGIRTRHPEEAARRSRLGKFYYQPPSGESWVDVVLRVRSLMRDLEHLDGADVWLVTHQAVIMAHRFVLEGLDEHTLLELGRDQPLPNVAMTVYERKGDLMELLTFADTSAVDETDAEVTHEPERPMRDRSDVVVVTPAVLEEQPLPQPAKARTRAVRSSSLAGTSTTPGAARPGRPRRHCGPAQAS